MTKNEYAIGWDQSFLIDIPIIDSQHKRLLKKIENLLNSIITKRGESEIGSLLKFLRYYTEGHFGTEENYMREFNYPGIDLHKKQHKLFTGMIREYQQIFNIKGGSNKLATNLEKNLLSWYKNHILTSDKELGEFLKQQGTFRKELEGKWLIEQVYEALDEYLFASTAEERLRSIKEAQGMLYHIEKEIIQL